MHYNVQNIYKGLLICESIIFFNPRALARESHNLSNKNLTPFQIMRDSFLSCFTTCFVNLRSFLKTTWLWSALHMYHKMSTFSAWKNVSAKQTYISFSNVFNLTFTVHERKLKKQHINTLYFLNVIFCYFSNQRQSSHLKLCIV